MKTLLEQIAQLKFEAASGAGYLTFFAMCKPEVTRQAGTAQGRYNRCALQRGAA